MLTQYQRELIHREIDGENTSDESIEVRKLVETQPEALALMTSLRDLDALFGEVPDRDTPPRVKELIHQAVSLNLRTAPKRGREQGITQSISRWAVQQWNGVTNLMEEFMLTKKVLIVATTAVAVIAIVGQAVVGYKPSVFDAGTVGAGDGMSGVQQAGRYKGHTLTEADVTLANPEIGALFQNDQVLKLIKSEVFQQAMRDNTFRELQSSEAYHALFASDANRLLLSSDTYHQLLASDVYHQLLANDSYHAMFANDSYQKVMASDAYHLLLANDAYRQILSSDVFLKLLSNDTFREIMSNDAYRQILSSDVFLRVMANDNYRVIMANDAYRMVLASDTFRAISQSASLSDAFMSEAMRVQ